MTRKEAIKVLEDGRMPHHKMIELDTWCEAFSMAIDALKQEGIQQETGRERGEWLHPNVVAMPYSIADKCSCCREWGKVLTFNANFCPNCGADMREGES
jgi:hypothetical protein